MSELNHNRNESLVDELLPTIAGQLYLKLRTLPEEEQGNFILLLMLDAAAKKKSPLGHLIDALLSSHAKKAQRIEELNRKLSRHRRPKKNAERDAEIVRLNHAGRSAGQIVTSLADRWRLTDKMVNAVISRERKKKSPK